MWWWLLLRWEMQSKLIALRKLTSVVQPYLHEPEVGVRSGFGKKMHSKSCPTRWILSEITPGGKFKQVQEMKLRCMEQLVLWSVFWVWFFKGSVGGTLLKMFCGFFKRMLLISSIGLRMDVFYQCEALQQDQGQQGNSVVWVTDGDSTFSEVFFELKGTEFIRIQACEAFKTLKASVFPCFRAD